jgi:hypothetical protein
MDAANDEGHDPVFDGLMRIAEEQRHRQEAKKQVVEAQVKELREMKQYLAGTSESDRSSFHYKKKELNGSTFALVGGLQRHVGHCSSMSSHEFHLCEYAATTVVATI